MKSVWYKLPIIFLLILCFVVSINYLINDYNKEIKQRKDLYNKSLRDSLRIDSLIRILPDSQKNVNNTPSKDHI